MGRQQIHLAYAMLAFTSTVQTAKQCYFPDGTLGDWTACDETKEHSACCAPDDACLSNGYCFQQTNAPDTHNLRISRGLCTDKAWESTECPQFCTEVNSNATVTVQLVEDKAQGRWCCSASYNSVNDTCDISTGPSGQTPFTLEPGQIIYNRKSGDTLSAKTTFDNNASVTTTVTAKADNKNVAIGAGVGVSLGLLLLLAAAALVLLMLKLNNLKRQHRESQQHLQLLPQDNKAPYADPMPQPMAAHYGLWNPAAPQEAPAENSRVELGTEPDVKEAPTSQAIRR